MLIISWAAAELILLVHAGTGWQWTWKPAIDESVEVIEVFANSTASLKSYQPNMGRGFFQQQAIYFRVGQK